MTNFKQWALGGSLGAFFMVAALTGCSYYNGKEARETGRTVNQVENDKATTTRVHDTLSRDPVYKYPQVKVQTYQGIVQLSGFVNTDEQKRNAEQIAQSIPGVNRVVNEITVVPQNATPTGRGGTDTNSQFNQGQGSQTNAPGSYRQ
jgi:hypothetical protein